MSERGRHARELIDAGNPYRSIRALETAMGHRQIVSRTWAGPAAPWRSGRIPRPELIETIASRLVGVSAVTLLQAYLRDAGRSIELGLTQAQHAAAELVASVPTKAQPLLLDVLRVAVRLAWLPKARGHP